MLLDQEKAIDRVHPLYLEKNYGSNGSSDGFCGLEQGAILQQHNQGQHQRLIYQCFICQPVTWTSLLRGSPIPIPLQRGSGTFPIIYPK